MTLFDDIAEDDAIRAETRRTGRPDIHCPVCFGDQLSLGSDSHYVPHAPECPKRKEVEAPSSGTKGEGAIEATVSPHHPVASTGQKSAAPIATGSASGPLSGGFPRGR